MRSHPWQRWLGMTVLAWGLAVGPVCAEESVIPRFEVRRYLVEGNTILPTDQMATILQRYTGKELDFADIQGAMEALEQAYRERGYTLVTVVLPEQELVSGEVLLKVLEPRVKEIKVEGNKHYDQDNVLRSLPTLEAGQPPRVTAISENLRAANENPSKKLTLQFKALAKPEDLQATVQVLDQKPWKIGLGFDNTGSETNSEYRASLMMQYDNLWNRDHVVALQYITSPDAFEEVQSVSGSYRVPLYGWGDTVDFYGGYSDIDGTVSIGAGTGVAFTGKGTIAGGRYTFNLPRIGAYAHKILLGSDYREYTADNRSFQNSSVMVVHPLSMTYGMSWQGKGVSFDGFAGVVHNEPWGGNSGQQHFDAFRSGGDAPPDYWLFRYGMNKLVALPGDWLVRVAGSGQYTWDRLVSGEQFGLGGMNSVRGYQEREEAWDAGFAGSFELYGPDLGRISGAKNCQLRLLGFFDGGTGYNLRARPGEFDSNALTSIGVGLRSSYGEYLSVSVDWGYALNQSLSSNPAMPPTKEGDSRVHFKVQMVF